MITKSTVKDLTAANKIVDREKRHPATALGHT